MYIDLEIDFDAEMDCETVTSSLSLKTSTGIPDVTPYIATDTVACRLVKDGESLGNDSLFAAPLGVWRWSATIADAYDGIYRLTLAGSISTNVSFLKGSAGDLSSDVNDSVYGPLPHPKGPVHQSYDLPAFSRLQ